MENRASEFSTKKIATFGILIALTTVATMIISIPTPTRGYVNLGDSVVMLSGVMLGPLGGFLVGGIGSALADLLLGYAYYAPLTFAVKGLEGLIVALVYKKLLKETKLPVALVLGGLWMATGYLIGEIFMWGWPAAIGSFPHNVLQGMVGAGICYLLYQPVKRFYRD
ncbi:MAG: ECF transporter S component [Tissierellia bacterium]|nr:ECF transporter S component [Tissierellia bacterium]